MTRALEPIQGRDGLALVVGSTVAAHLGTDQEFDFDESPIRADMRRAVVEEDRTALASGTGYAEWRNRSWELRRGAETK